MSRKRTASTAAGVEVIATSVDGTASKSRDGAVGTATTIATTAVMASAVTTTSITAAEHTTDVITTKSVDLITAERFTSAELRNVTFAPPGRPGGVFRFAAGSTVRAHWCTKDCSCGGLPPLATTCHHRASSFLHSLRDRNPTRWVKCLCAPFNIMMSSWLKSPG